jgi:tetratricopeptide (TPR) repeat protein
MGLPGRLCHDAQKSQVALPFMNKSSVLLIALVLLGGCRSFSLPDSDGSVSPVAEDAGAQASAKQNYASFSEETLLALLTAELAGQRNRFDIALDNYVRQAQVTQDAGVAERGFRIAEYLGAEQQALDTALLWAKNAPESVDAQRAAALQLARAGRYDEAMSAMEDVLRRHGSTHFDFLALSAAQSDPETRAGLLQSFDRLLLKHPTDGQLLFGKALLLQQDGRSQEAIELLESSQATQDQGAPLLLRARLLQGAGRGEEALPLLKKGIAQHPDDKRLRLTYARQLVELGHMDEARGEFSALLQQFPDDDDVRFSLALVYLQAEAWQEAKVYFEALIERDSHVDAAYYNLGRANEALDEVDAALAAYEQVAAGEEEYLPAQARLVGLLAKQGRNAEASAHLAAEREQQPDYAVQLYLLESESLSRQHQAEKAWQLIQEALRRYPGDLDLLYARAMLAEPRNDLQQLERDLRTILDRSPGSPMVLNALGYTLVDRTERYQEGLRLIEQAYAINPTDPAILDSLGWANFRLNNLGEAEKWLRQAFERFPDHEIAAHLGEALWSQNKQHEARAVWRDALKQQPDSEILRSTVLRLTGSETP